MSSIKMIAGFVLGAALAAGFDASGAPDPTQLVLDPKAGTKTTKTRSCATKVVAMEQTCSGAACMTTYASCFPHRCDAEIGACRMGECSSADDCAGGAVCNKGKCQGAKLKTERSCVGPVMSKTVACQGGLCETSHASCFPYRCAKGSGACDVATCEGDGDCAKGAMCLDGTCQFEEWKCKAGEATGYLTNGRDTVSCVPYNCKDGRCLATCKSTADCSWTPKLSGRYACNADGHCVRP